VDQFRAKMAIESMLYPKGIQIMRKS